MDTKKRLKAEGAAEPKWHEIRHEFRLDPSRIHLANFLIASPPKRVRTAADEWRARLDSDPLLLESFLLGNFAEMGSGVAQDSPYVEAKQAMASYLGAPSRDVAFIPNTTTGLALVYNGLFLTEDAEIIITPDAHYSHHQAAHRAAEKKGAKVRNSPLYRDPARVSKGEILESVRTAISPRTRCLGLTWVSSRTGVKLPVAEISEIVADVNRIRDPADQCLLVVDGVHGFGSEDQEVARLGADFFISGAHKWFLGPAGTGVLYGRPDAWARITPTIPSFEIDATLHNCWLGDRPLPATQASFIAPGGFTDYANIFALAEAVRFHQDLGRAAIADRIQKLNTYLREELAAITGIRLLTPVSQEMASGFVCFQVAGNTPANVVAILGSRDIRAAASPYAEATVRMAASIVNTYEEIDFVLRVLRSIRPAD